MPWLGYCGLWASRPCQPFSSRPPTAGVVAHRPSASEYLHLSGAQGERKKTLNETLDQQVPLLMHREKAMELKE